MTGISIGLELGQLANWLTEARRLDEQQANCREHIARCAQAEQAAARNQEDADWIRELAAEYDSQAANAGEQLADLHVKIRSEISRLERMSSHSIRLQMELARFLDEQGRNGTPVAQRAALLTPASAAEALNLSAYLADKGCYPDAIRAVRQGWQRFGDRVLRSQWSELLERHGPINELIELLSDDLRGAPDDLALIERLARCLLQAGRSQEAFGMMVRALEHPAGGTRLLASFMMDLTAAGQEALALTLAGRYVAGRTNRMEVCRELAEILRREGYLRTALAFLDQELQTWENLPEAREIAGYRTVFLVNSVRSDRPAIRKDAIALLRARRDSDVERQLSALYDTTRGDELRLVMVYALAEIQGPSGLSFLGHALTCNARRVRLAATREMGNLRARIGSDAGTQEGQPAKVEASTEDNAAPVLAAARKLLLERLQDEPDEGVRQAIVEALHQLDPGPRRPWERLLGTRPWAEPAPQAPPLPSPQRRRRRAAIYAGLLAVLALVALAVLPLEPSPRKVVLGYGVQGVQVVSTQIARRRATPTPRPTPSPAPTRAEPRVDVASGQVSDVTAGDTVRVQLGGQTATVRYLGVEAPGLGQPGARAALDANRRLVATRLVRLEEGSIPKDSSGRWLRYVWLPEGQMANVKLLELGFAAPSPDLPDAKYQQQLAEAATKAWKEKAGFWRGGSDVFPMAAVRSVDANVREGPGTNQPVKLQVKQGAVFPVVGRNAGKDWIQVKIPGYATGWMSTQVVETTVPAASLPLAQ